MRARSWEDPETVEEFARRAPDHRLVKWVERYPDPSAIRVLDLGCAGGRNTDFLVRAGFPVWALDASPPMIERTRARVESVLGPDLSRERVRIGRMDELSDFDDGFFQLVIALGIYHNARSRAEWEDALAETARVLKRGGHLLVSHFTPETDLTGEGVEPVAGAPGVYSGFPGGDVVLVKAGDLDRAMTHHRLEPVQASETVCVRTDTGRRVSVNALYRKM